MKHFLLMLFVSLSFVGISQTKSVKKTPPLIEAAPEIVGMSSERLDRITNMLQKAVKEDDIPGVVALVARNGKIVYYKAFGMSDNETGRQLKKDDIFRIASQSKAITSTAVMMLWEEGKFKLDDPISKYIPEFKNPVVIKDFHYADTTYSSVPAKSEITIRQLLTHTSGIGYGIIDDEPFRMIYQKAGVTDLFTTKEITIGESVRKLAKLPLHFNPGEKFSYSEGLDVLGYFIEVVSGMPFDVFLKEHIFKPLGMNDTGFYLPDEKASRLVKVQHLVNGQWKHYPTTFYDPDYPIKGAKKFFSGGAGLSSTAKDYATFIQMYLNGGEYNGVRLLSRTTVQSIMGNQVGDLFWDADKYYGLAFSVLRKSGQDKGGFTSEGTFEWGGYFSTSYFGDPKERLVGILMRQHQGKTNDNTENIFRMLVGQAVDD